ncbi:MAG: hypothetical protein JWO74_3839 [Solirubrobacterales bacterium]|nr:hypothetical protein [Solirubrobacterales bacterium]
MSSYRPPSETALIGETLKRVVAALRSADVEFALAGSVACWARGGPPPCNDLDFAIHEADGDRTLEAFAAAGMRTERPPEGWLVKAFDGDVLVDLIFDFEGIDDVAILLGRAEHLTVEAVRLPVLALDDIVVSKLCALDEHSLDLAMPLQIARALREKIDWPEVRRRTAHSPYARGFLSMLEALEIIHPSGVSPAGRLKREPRVRVVGEG